MAFLPVLLLVAFSSTNQLDINQASLDQLRELPVKLLVAERIHEYLTEYGRLNSIYDLMNVEGMNSARLEDIKPLVYVSPAPETEGRLKKVHRIQKRLASEEGPTASAVEEWQDMLLAPMNINRARIDDLAILDNVSLVDAASIVKYLNSGLTIRDRRDLAYRIPGLSSYGYRNIRDFISYENATGALFGGNYRLSYELDPDWETVVAAGEFGQALAALEEDSAEFREAGYTAAEMVHFRAQLEAERDYLAEPGNSAELQNRLRVRLGDHIRGGGWVTRKSYGPGAFDGFRGFISGRSLGPLRKAVAGDFHVTLGQGLLLDNTSELRARVHEHTEGLYSNLTENTGFGFRGGAAELGASRFSLLGFYSQANRDAIMNPDSTINYYIITTPRYPVFRDNLEETDIGGSARFDLSGLTVLPVGTRLALNALSVGYDREFKPDAKYLDVPGDAERLVDPNYTRLSTGTERLFYGTDFRTVIENVSFEGELALQPELDSTRFPSSGMNKAWLVKAHAQYDYLYLTALYRHYDVGYDNPYNRGYCEQLRFEDTPLEKSYRLIDPAYSALQDFPMPKAEEGFLFETRYQISRKITLTRAYIDVWRNLAWGLDNVRFQAELEYRPVHPLRIRFKQKIQSKGLPKPARSTRSLTMEASIKIMASLANRDFLSAELREGRIMLTPTLEYTDRASMSGNFLALQWEHNFSDDFSGELGVVTWLTRGMSHWIFEDTGIDFLEGDGLKWYVALSDRVSDRLLLYLKCRQTVSRFPHTALGGDEGIHFPGSAEPVHDFLTVMDSFNVALQFDLFW